MSLYNQLLNDLKEAMLSKNQDKTLVLRALKAAVLKKEISERKGGEAAQLTDSDIIEVFAKEAKQRKDSIEQFEKAGRTDLSEKEKFELEVIESYLPKQLSKEEISAIIDSIISETGATSISDIGKVMPILMPKVKGIADGKLVNTLVREKLS